MLGRPVARLELVPPPWPLVPCVVGRFSASPQYVARALIFLTCTPQAAPFTNIAALGPRSLATVALVTQKSAEEQDSRGLN